MSVETVNRGYVYSGTPTSDETEATSINVLVQTA